MAVTQKQRARAKRQARATAAFERKSIEAAGRLGFRMMSRSLNAFKQNRILEIDKIIDQEYERSRVLLVEAMTLAYLTGLDRLREGKGKVLQAALHEAAIEALKDRLQVDPAKLAEITERMNVQAVKVLKRSSDAVERSLQKTILNITQEGLSRPEGVRRLRDAFARNGIVPVNSFEVEAVFRTQTQFAYSAGTWSASQDPAVDEILWGYKYVTVGDDRVRDEHAALDGVTAKKDAPIWQSIWPPNGWGCRCQVIFLFEPEEPELPGSKEIDGRIIKPVPDKGFDFNPGTVLSTGPIRKSEAIGAGPLRKKPVKRVQPEADAQRILRAENRLKRDVLKERAPIEGFSDLPVEMAELVQGELTSLVNKYGVKFKKISVTEKIAADTFAEVRFDSIRLNKKYFKNPKRLAKTTAQMAKDKWFVGDRIEDLLVHEYGHTIAFQNKFKKPKTKKLILDAFKKNQGWRSMKISRYAAQDADEMFAEAFNQFHKGLEMQDWARKLVKDVLKEAGI